MEENCGYDLYQGYYEPLMTLELELEYYAVEILYLLK